MALRAGAAFVDLVPRLSRAFGRDAERQMSGPLSGLGTKLGSGLGTKIALGLGVGLAAAGAGVAAFAFDAGKKLDDALDNIRIKTGQTGAALAGLEGSFRNVAKQVPNDMGQVSDAVAELAQRTGLTGKPLEDLAVKALTLSRITKKDLSATIEESTRLFGDWGIAVADQGASLDFLFKLSQQTGVGVDFLQQKLVQFGGPLRQLGFSMEESAALVAKFQKEGVNTELVLGSMRQALGRMARAGEAPAETFRRVTAEIKAAGSAGDANAKALELFGARAGPDMAAAIREGRFEIDGLLESVGASSDSILTAAKDTDGFSETLARLRNRATLVVEPLATKMVQGLDKLADHVEPLLASLGDKLPGAFAAVERGVSRVAPVVQNVVRAVAEAWPQIRAAIEPVITTVVALIEERWPRIQAIIEQVLLTIIEIVRSFSELVQVIWRNWGEQITRFVTDSFDATLRIIDGTLQVIRGVIDTVLGLLTGDWGRAWDGLKNIVAGVWQVIGGLIDRAIATVRFVVSVGLDLLAGIFSGAWEGITSGITGAFDGIVDFFGRLPGRLARAAGDVFGFLWRSFKGAINLVIRGWNNLEFKIPGFDPPGPGPSFGGITLGVPNIPELRDAGGSTFAGRSYMVGPGLVELFSPGRGHVMPQEKLIDALVGAEERGGSGMFRDLIVPTASDATADELVDAINAKLGWKLTTRKDR